MNRRSARPFGYTFLEVTLALGLALILVAGIYSAVQMTYQQWEVGRQAADEAQVVRALFQRIRADIQATLTTWQPPPTPQAATGAAGAGAAGAATGATPGATTGAATAATGSTGSSSGGSSTAAQNTTDFPPGGVLGDSSTISVVSRLTPNDLDFSQTLPAGTTASVLKTITYRIGSLQDSSSIDDGQEGLIRDESPGMPDAITPDGHSQNGRSDLLAPEVKRLRISYYDGLVWGDSWDLTQSGAPVCVQIEVALKFNTYKNVDSDGLRWYQALIAFPPAAAASSESGGAASSGGSTGSTGGSTGSTGGSSTGASGASGATGS